MAFSLFSPWRPIANSLYTTNLGPTNQPNLYPPPPGISSSDQHSGIPIGPPPGLVRVTMSVPIGYYDYMKARRGRPVIRKNSQVALFSDVVKYFEHPIDRYGNHIMFDLTCSICCENKLEMPSRVTPPRSPGDNVMVEPLCVLPCGHMFGAWCMDNWMAACREGDKPINCPLCRRVLHYNHCGHEIRIRHYDPRFHRAGQLALTLPEGGCIPSTCEWCSTSHVKEWARRVADTIYPENIPETAFINLSKCGPNDFKDMRARMEDYLYDEFCKAEDTFDHW
ncbi:hypothetical protein F5B19DRAFT_114659 [Rostrohypoxylon terebratum]|nr:hypothetical protein F5B19DRAFT_114659 [Rostrohypoxylon terebratum]